MTSLLPFLAFLTAGALAQTPSRPLKPPAREIPVPAGITVEHGVIFGRGGGRDLHAEIAYPSTSAKTPRPAVILVHGGGWANGKPADWLSRVYAFAAAGYFTASIEYRLVQEAPWPAQIEDCKLAVRWVRANAEKFQIDPNRIGAWGGSAGAHLVACLGTMADVAEYEGGGGYPGVSSRVQAVVEWSGPVDFTTGSFGDGSDRITPKTREADSRMVAKLLGATFAENPALWKKASPLMHVKPSAPPFLIVHGENDEVVSLRQSELFKAALEKAGVPVEFILIRGGHGGHAWVAKSGEPPAQPDQNELLQAAIEFFNRRLKG